MDFCAFARGLRPPRPFDPSGWPSRLLPREVPRGGMLRNRCGAAIQFSANHEHAAATVWFLRCCLTLLTEFLGSFAYGLGVVVSWNCENILDRLGDQGDKHVHSLRGPCDRCSAIFIFRASLENSHYAVSDIATRDLISSWFRFPWELTLSDFWAFVRPLVPCEQMPIGQRPSATLYPTWWRGYSVGTRGVGNIWWIGGYHFVENGMESNYGVWIWLGKTRINFS